MCVALDRSTNKWSTEGIITDEHRERNITLCKSSHLTSFAVLIRRKRVQLSRLEKLISSYTTYALLSVSLIFLLATFLIFFKAGKNFFKKTTNAIYLNYLIALTMGTVLFIFGMETVWKYHIPCTIVALLLHYFWTAVFTWTLCNGIYMIYLFFFGKYS